MNKHEAKAKLAAQAKELMAMSRKVEQLKKWDIMNSVFGGKPFGEECGYFWDSYQDANDVRKGYKGRTWKPRKVDFGKAPEQLKIVLKWTQRIFIDMKEAIGKKIEWLKGFQNIGKLPTKELLKMANTDLQYNVSEFRKDFESTGSVEKCPSYVYFLD